MVYATYLRPFFEWQRGFHAESIRKHMVDIDFVPAHVAVLYIMFVFIGSHAMRKRQPFRLKWITVGWNALLAVFSVLGAFATAPQMLSVLATEGERYALCTSAASWYFNGASGLWMAAFILSKIPELLDTVFLVLQKKPVIFLHWYHHFTVMLFCWYAFVFRLPSGLWFGTMNYCVHAIMYTYFGMMEASKTTRRIAKPFAMVITALQILQMVVGLYVTVRTQLILLDEGDSSTCEAPPVLNAFGLAMYFSYFVLFAQLFYKKYFVPSAAKAKAE